MDKATFCALFREAYACEAPQMIFVKQYAEYADAAELRSVYAMAHAPQRDLIYATGYTLRSLSAMIQIPVRTIENWTANHRPMPYYVRLLIAMICCNPKLDAPCDFSL